MLSKGKSKKAWDGETVIALYVALIMTVIGCITIAGSFLLIGKVSPIAVWIQNLLSNA